MTPREAFLKRAERFSPRYEVRSRSHVVRTRLGEVRWAAETLIMEDLLHSTVYRTMFPTPKRTYDTKAMADAVALWLGLEWLEEGLPNLPRAPG